MTKAGNVAEYYQKLSKEELMERKKSQTRIYLSTSVAWLAALLMTLYAAKMDPELIILYSGVVVSLLITLFADYRKRIKLINDLIDKK